MKIQYHIDKNDSNLTIKKILKEKLFVSTRLLNKLKLSNSILVNNVSKPVNHLLNLNDNIILDFDNMNNENTDKFLDKYEPYDFHINILHEDEYILIVEKPSNMIIHPTCNDRSYTLANAIAKYLEAKQISSIHILTRLDKDTSGICILAKNEYIQELFERKKDSINFKKEYICIVNGIVKKNHDFITKKIARSPNSIITREINENGDFAKTEYFILKKLENINATVLSVILHTGRTHQIRVHLNSIGHTLLGDDLYANEDEKNMILNYIKRQALHCSKISFYHPITNEFIEITSLPPNDMLNIIE